MSRINKLISIGIEDPEFYAELLSVTPRDANRRLLSNEQPCPDIPGIHDVDAKHIQTLLDVVADISLCQKGNVSATMACIKQDKDALETQLYIAFNHENDEAAHRCPEHLQSIFWMLHRVLYLSPAPDGSPKVSSKELEDRLVEICGAIHNYSYDIFEYRVNKHKHKLSQIRGYIEQESTYFSPEQRSTLVNFLNHVDMTIKVVDAHATKQLSRNHVQMLLNIYSYWTNHNLLPDDRFPDNKVTLLDHADAWLAEAHNMGFQLRRWAIKIMSFVSSTNRLFMLAQSRRLRHILDGKFTVQVLSSPTTIPYYCDLSLETMEMAVNTALAEAEYHPPNLDEERAWFMESLEKGLEAHDVFHENPTVHAELVLIIAMAEGKINNVKPYIGVSKLPCIMCSHYIRAFNEVVKQKIAIKGSHGKAYTGWSWPRLPSHDGELRLAFLKLIRQQVRSDFEQYAHTRRLLDSSVGSGFPRLDLDATEDKILELFEAGF